MASDIVAADLGADTPDGFLPVTALGFGRDRFAPPPALVRKVAAAAGAAPGPVLTLSTVTGTAERVGALLAAHPGALAEAMEGFGVAEAAARAEVPVMELRAVSNAVGPATGTPGASATRWRRSRRRSGRRDPYWKVGTGMTTEANPDAIEIAFSPCPNDTFVFDAWAHDRVPGAPALKVTFADIDITNGMAERGELDVLKVSYAVLPWVLDEYALLPCGGALGRGCGPLVLTKELGLDLTGRTVAVPSERSTAYLLFRLWAAEMVPGGVGEVVVMPFDEIMPAVRDGKVDSRPGHPRGPLHVPELRSAQPRRHGRHWEDTTGLPIPLGAIIAKRSLGEETLRRLADAVRSSVRLAWDHPEVSRPYVLEHAQEMDPAVADQHIGLYVNEFTADLGEDGYAAIRGLLTRAAAEGLVPPLGPDALAFP